MSFFFLLCYWTSYEANQATSKRTEEDNAVATTLSMSRCASSNSSMQDKLCDDLGGMSFW